MITVNRTMTKPHQPSTINHQPSPPHPRVLTNMAFWQSPVWTANTDSIYVVSSHRSASPSLPFWREAWALFRRRSDYDVVVTMGARESLAYGLLCAATGRPSRQILTEFFIDSPNVASPLWRLKTWLQRLVARRAVGILTNSSAEIETIAARLGIPMDNLRFVPLHTTIHEPRPSDADEGFVLTAGLTLRDYPTLLKATEKIEQPVRVICGGDDLRGEPVPPNVSVLRDIPYSEYLDHLRRCAMVVLPLQATERSTGQVVMLEAMALGKPVIATRSTGTVDYIRNGENGLLVDAGDADAIADAVRKLRQDPAAGQRLAAAALDDVKSRYTFDLHAEAKLEAIRALWASRPAASSAPAAADGC